MQFIFDKGASKRIYRHNTQVCLSSAPSFKGMVLKVVYGVNGSENLGLAQAVRSS